MADVFEVDFYKEINEYANKNNLQNLLKVLSFVRTITYVDVDYDIGNTYFSHALQVAWLLADLNLPIESGEEDIMLSATICHILPEIKRDYDYENELAKIGVIPEVGQLISVLTKNSDLDEKNLDDYYDQLKNNRLAYMIRLVDRANLIEQLYGTDIIEARIYIAETKKYILPLCLWGKEQFPEFIIQINIIMEKIKTLLQVVEILYNKYESEEFSILNDILALKEENSNIRRVIKELSV